MIAALFIGQGVDLPWVDDDVLAQQVVAERVAIASAHAGCDVMRLLRRGGRDLARSEIVQPAMVAVCLGVHRLLEQAAVLPDVVLGHSLGELTAWAAAGGLADRDAIALAASRG
ncbi:MAG TPA: acyltransferase domain-containing protein, partial [Kofleriaceae bacterium]